MSTYRFRGLRHGDNIVTVEAASEEDARHLAMCERWGPPHGMYGTRYAGLGLILISVQLD